MISGNLIQQTNMSDEIDFYGKFLRKLPEMLGEFFVKFLIAIVIFYIGCKLIKLIRKILKRTLNKSKIETGVTQFLDSFVKFVLLTVLIILIASFFGFETTSLIALLGSAGVTIALALQGSLSNFTGGVLILLLKPFKVGDYIIEDTKGNEGTVEEIQMFFTKLKTIDDRIVILPNGTLANASLTNVNQTPIRRVCISVGIAYESDIKEAKNVIKQTVMKNVYLLKDKTIDIYVDELADSCVKIGIRYYVLNEHYFESKWAVLESIKYALDEAGIKIPYNQLEVYVEENKQKNIVEK